MKNNAQKSSAIAAPADKANECILSPSQAGALISTLRGIAKRKPNAQRMDSAFLLSRFEAREVLQFIGKR